MKTYFVHYSYNTTYPSFSSQYAHVFIQAENKEQAIKKARKQAPKNATHFRAYLK